LSSFHPSPEVEICILDKRLVEWGIPRYQSEMAAAIDLFACIPEPVTLTPGSSAVLVPAGFSLFLRNPHLAAMVLPRSGLGHRSGLVLGNLVGLIDADYQGPVMVSVWNRNGQGSVPVTIQPGDRLAQMIFVPVVRPVFSVVESFSEKTERGSGGFGSTGV
jgi:dUTP pyrophosphatase